MALHVVPLQAFLSEGWVSVGPNARQSIVMGFFYMTLVPYHCFFSDFSVLLIYAYSLSFVFLPNLIYYLRVLAIIHHTFCADVFVIKKSSLFYCMAPDCLELIRFNLSSSVSARK